MKSPIPWHGGKRRVAARIWAALGDPEIFIEPFAGSLATLLARPTPGPVEIVNDLDGHLVNFWRSIVHHPAETAAVMDGPIAELDLVARQDALMGVDLTARLAADPRWCDPKLARWWAHGLCAAVGSSGDWCRRRQRTKIPQISCSGLHALAVRDRRVEVLSAVADRLRHVRIACGDWSRILTPVWTASGRPTGILLDPPYTSSMHGGDVYTSGDVAGDVARWAVDHGDDPTVRIVLCGLAGEHDRLMPSTWRAVRWKRATGHLRHGRTAEEVPWMSPSTVGQGTLL